MKAYHTSKFLETIDVKECRGPGAVTSQRFKLKFYKTLQDILSFGKINIP